ncbi:MAG: hypothetical protein AB1641_21710 [Thermodesulfobacteriota bacterium]
MTSYPMRAGVIILAAILVQVFFPGVTRAQATGPTGQQIFEQDPQVEQMIRTGTLTSMTGTLKKSGERWIIATNNGDYEIYLSRQQKYITQNGATLKEGQFATIKGFVSENKIVATELRMGGYSLRSPADRKRTLPPGSGGQSVRPSGKKPAEPREKKPLPSQ